MYHLEMPAKDPFNAGYSVQMVYYNPKKIEDSFNPEFNFYFNDSEDYLSLYYPDEDNLKLIDQYAPFFKDDMYQNVLWVVMFYDTITNKGKLFITGSIMKSALYPTDYDTFAMNKYYQDKFYTADGEDITADIGLKDQTNIKTSFFITGYSSSDPNYSFTRKQLGLPSVIMPPVTVQELPID